MTYLNACIYETARLEMQGNQWRLAMYDQEFNGYHIPKGTLIGLYSQSIHRNPLLFKGKSNSMLYLKN